jgi:geranylgeranylglycerol-phosphate geranylgeranyltransferase
MIQLTRPGNLVLIAVAVVTGAVLASGADEMGTGVIRPLAMAVAATVMIAAGANALNDALDVDVDRINCPARPIPAGIVSRRSAISLWILTTVAGLVLAYGVSRRHFVLAVASAALLALYNHRLKHVAVVGNVICAAAVAATLIFGGLIFDLNTGVLVASAFALLTMLAREIVKDLEDLVGDGAAGSRTLPAIVGSKSARAAALAVIVVTIAAVPVPYVAFNFSGTYLLVSVLAVIFLLSSAWILSDLSRPEDADPATGARSRHIERYARVSLYLKLSMIAGLTAILFARLPA